MFTWVDTDGHHIHPSNYIQAFFFLVIFSLSFEIAWPGHILTITPQNGMVEPMEQKVLLVSANPSIQSKGVILPWSGTIYVSCDNQEKVRALLYFAFFFFHFKVYVSIITSSWTKVILVIRNLVLVMSEGEPNWHYSKIEQCTG